jgi:hypothetical protein
MSINSKSKATVDGLLTNSDTTESNFKEGLEDVTTEVNSLNEFTQGPFSSSLASEDLSIDLSTGNNFSLSISSNGDLTFSNITAGQSGNIYLNNTNGSTISKGTGIKANDSDFTTITNQGEYWLSYFAYDSSNVLVISSAILTGT